MTGLHILAGQFDSGLANWDSQWPAVSANLFHAPGYTSNVVMEDLSLWIGYTGFEGYPVKCFDAPKHFIAIEGYVYNKTQAALSQSLSRLADELCNGGKPDSSIKNWILSADGDYIVVIVDKDNRRFWLFNDPMGRLPIYRYFSNSELLISRETKFITATLRDYEYDRFGIGETLVFGYTLGHSTLVKDVHRLYGGTIVAVDLKDLSVTLSRTYEFNMDELLDNPERIIKEYAASLVERFLYGCENLTTCFPGYTHIVSLSGGFDSRSVLAGMKRVGAKVRAFSYLDTDTDTRGRDAPHASQMAKILNVGWHLLERPKVDTDETDRLLWVKDGLNHAGMAFLLPLHRELRRAFGPKILHLTGDNGDRSLDPQGPPINLKDFDHFCKFVIERHTRIQVQDAADILGLSARDLTENIRQKLDKYPEGNLNNRYRHFILAERLFNWNFQAEDRNRTYFWHATPFSSFPYFEYAMGIPDKFKKYWQLFEEFLRLLDPRCLAVNYANWEAPIISYHRYWNPFKQSIYERLPTWLRIAIRDKTLYRGLELEEGWRQYLDKCMAGLDYHTRFLNVKKTQEFTKTCNINSFDNVLTFIAYMKLHGEKIARTKAEHK